MVVNRQYSAATEKLLKDRGLKCVCELCDCGRYHRHEGCTRNVQKMQQVFKRPGMGQVETDYQATYKSHNAAPRHLRRPLPKLRNPHPPPMDFRTEQRLQFVERELPFTKPCKMMESYTISSSKLDGATEYNQEYKDRGPPSIVHLSRPKTVTSKPEAKFQGETTHNATFTAKKPLPQATYGELPTFTGSILFPDKTSAMKTWNQEVYKGKYAPVAKTCVPGADQVDIGVEGDHYHTTTHQDTYKTPAHEGRQELQKRKAVISMGKRAKFQGDTQFRSDFPGYHGRMPKPAKSVQPPPATLSLKMNNDQNFETTNNDTFKITWDPKTIGRTQMMKPEMSTHVNPDLKMEVMTQTMVDYTQKAPVKVPVIRPPTRTEPSNIKFEGETAYQSQFKPHENVPFKRYGDFHESAVYLKPISKFHQDGSVTTQDFKGAIGGRPRTTFKPEQQLQMTDGKILDKTVYKADFIQKNQDECSYLKWVSNHQVQKEADKILQKQQPIEKREAMITGR
ncbi:predicted protein [Nematostella vectensis]|uniref:Uncharacterized protein n=1 Tax=Nematostella vectensis TaxID=45351 RepID=A7RHM3_NEMVE|nr:stabilizer of axonemal microtubules 2 [Nematostella vectensis]XP_032222329.1 stabilizer of axonemal microtubules 2 [Nematostella vectensis]EDO48878.1 predicted protein [Nematostella vectensis]|eukprot:XP_001640941.1 predicted protein [Nematostella vectensis]